MPVLGYGSISAVTVLHSVTPEQFGAVGNTPGHDDAPGVEAAIFAAVAACVADGSYVCEVVFAAEKLYYANRAPIVDQTINGVHSYATAQIAIPFVGPFSYASGANSPVVTLILRSSANGTQETASFIGMSPAIVSTPTSGGGVHSGGGVASVIGGCSFTGPGTNSGPGINAIHLVWDGLGITVPDDPPFTGLDANSFWDVHIKSGEIKAPTSGYVTITPCTHTLSYGLVLPYTSGNNQVIDFLEVAGFYVGINTCEHMVAHELWLYSNRIAFQPGPSAHGLHIGRVITAGNTYDIAEHTATSGVFQSVSATQNPWVIGVWDTEGASVLDVNNNLWITANYMSNGDPPSGALPAFPGGGGKNCTLTSIGRARGHMAAPPAVPASTVAYQNNLGRDAWVVVSGGVVSVVAIDGTATGLTSGQFVVPKGETIALTYSVTPTWAWWLF